MSSKRYRGYNHDNEAVENRGMSWPTSSNSDVARRGNDICFRFSRVWQAMQFFVNRQLRRISIQYDSISWKEPNIIQDGQNKMKNSRNRLAAQCLNRTIQNAPLSNPAEAIRTAFPWPHRRYAPPSIPSYPTQRFSPVCPD
jgi:hypothetical protein